MSLELRDEIEDSEVEKRPDSKGFKCHEEADDLGAVRSE